MKGLTRDEERYLRGSICGSSDPNNLNIGDCLDDPVAEALFARELLAWVPVPAPPGEWCEESRTTTAGMLALRLNALARGIRC